MPDPEDTRSHLRPASLTGRIMKCAEILEMDLSFVLAAFECSGLIQTAEGMADPGHPDKDKPWPRKVPTLEDDPADGLAEKLRGFSDPTKFDSIFPGLDDVVRDDMERGGLSPIQVEEVLSEADKHYRAEQQFLNRRGIRKWVQAWLKNRR